MNYNWDQESHSQNNLLNSFILCSSQMIPSVTSLMSNNNASVECHMIGCDTNIYICIKC